MDSIKNIIDQIRVTVEDGLTQLEAAQNDLVHVKLEQFKDKEEIAGIISKAQLLNEQYSAQVYDGLKLVNALIAQKSKEFADKIQS
ncbi:MAG: hypothetical protein KDD32_10735 [Bacteroidetes bacterium]|nr:hypothetical protein [Bacteroidota bacterium]